MISFLLAVSRLQTVKELNVFSLQYSKDFFLEFVVFQRNSYHAPLPDLALL